MIRNMQPMMLRTKRMTPKMVLIIITAKESADNPSLVVVGGGATVSTEMMLKPALL